MRKTQIILFLVLLNIISSTNVLAQPSQDTNSPNANVLTPDDVDAPNPKKHAIPATEEECDAKNGNWMQAEQGIVVNHGPFRCLNYTASDGGKSCQADSECEGGCAPVYDTKHKEHKVMGGMCYYRVSDYCLQEHYDHGVVSSCVY